MVLVLVRYQGYLSYMIGPDDPQQPQFQMSVSGEEALGVYANLVVISHTDTEVIMDFAIGLPGIEQPVVRSRIVMAPAQAKRFEAALSENLGIYESQFGKIADPGQTDDSSE